MIKPSELLRLGLEKNLWPEGEVALDTETSGLYTDDGARVSTVSLAWEDTPDYVWQGIDGVNHAIERFGGPHDGTPIVSVAWPFDQGTTGKPEDNGQEDLFASNELNLPESEWTALLLWLAIVGSRVGFVMHNSKFDCHMMREGCRRWPGVGVDLMDYVRWDTQNGNALIYPLLTDPVTKRVTTSLKPSTSILFEEDAADESRVVKDYLKRQKLPAGRWDLMPWDVIGTYADKDARLTKRLQLRQEHDIDNGKVDWMPDAYKALARRLDTTRVLYRMERAGLPFNEVKSMEAAALCRERADQLALALPFNPTPEQAKHYYFGEGQTKRGKTCLGLTPYSVTEKGSPQLTAEIVTRMVNDGVLYAKEYAEWVKVSNAAGMWYEGYAEATGADGRLRTNFRQNGTRSSRFSVERVNLQAIPQDYRLTEFAVLEGIPTPRQLIGQEVARLDGLTLFELDLAQAELRVGAMFAGCTRMLDMIRNDEDLHTFTTLALFPNVSKDDPLFKSKWRQVGKRANFSLQFGAGGLTFANMVRKEAGVDLTPIQAAKIVRDWNALYPEYEVAIERHQIRVAQRQSRYGHGWLDFINHERRWFVEYEESRKAFNQRVQGNLAQFGIDWMLETNAFLTRVGIPDNQGLVLTIHDSQVLLLPTDGGTELAAECATIGKRLWMDWFPDVPGDVDYKPW